MGLKLKSEDCVVLSNYGLHCRNNEKFVALPNCGSNIDSFNELEPNESAHEFPGTCPEEDTHFYCSALDGGVLMAYSAKKCEKDAAILGRKLNTALSCTCDCENLQNEAERTGKYLRNVEECGGPAGPMQGNISSSLGLICKGHFGDPRFGPGRFVGLNASVADCEASIATINKYQAPISTTAPTISSSTLKSKFGLSMFGVAAVIIS